jgi:hypothetical protein
MAEYDTENLNIGARHADVWLVLTAADSAFMTALAVARTPF